MGSNEPMRNECSVIYMKCFICDRPCHLLVPVHVLDPQFFRMLVKKTPLTSPPNAISSLSSFHSTIVFLAK